MYLKPRYKEIFKNSLIKTNINHDEAIEVFENVSKSEKYTLINFDTHSDVYINIPITISTIANWVNYIIMNFNLENYFWVIPDFIRQNDRYKKVFERENTLGIDTLIFFNEESKDFQNTYTQTMFIDKQRQELLSKEKVNHINNKCRDFELPYVIDTKNLLAIKANRCFAQDLPNFRNKKIMLSVDADYFCNTGFDTMESINNRNITEKELSETFEKFLDILYEKNIRPDVVSLTLSPIYTPEKYKDIIMEFFGELSCPNRISPNKN